MKNSCKYIQFTFLFLLLTRFSFNTSKADEGMWLPILIEEFNIVDMQARGFKLSADDIYNVNSSSLKDAVVLFGGGCTGEIVSGEGLLFTNHHCGYPYIQSHSTLQDNYLENGFWASTREDELPNPGLTATFLVRMEDVTGAVLKGINEKTSFAEREIIINENIDSITRAATENTHHEADVEEFYYGNAYYLFIYEVFRDIRLVGTPPSSIGKFGGDTDNWMWPRHTGDFSVFRVYADTNNQPADYSPDNVPYKPRHHFPVSLKGIEKGDFTMVLGYPYSTREYLLPEGVSLQVNVSMPHKIKLREKRLAVMNAVMEDDPLTRIQYATKYARTSNSWKKWQGIITGIEFSDGIKNKKIYLNQYLEWLNKNSISNSKYLDAIAKLKDLYIELEEYQLPFDYLNEAIFAIELLDYAGNYLLLNTLSYPDVGEDMIAMNFNTLQNKIPGFFKNYNSTIDKRIFVDLIEQYLNVLEDKYIPGEFKKLLDKYKGAEGLADYLYAKSILLDTVKLNKLLYRPNAKSIKKILDDPAVEISEMFIEMFNEEIKPGYIALDNEIEDLYRVHMKGLMEYEEKNLYPDANFTMRLAYGEVKDYYPRDGVHYLHQTHLRGVMQKADPDISDYNVPPKLVELYEEKNYGPYGSDSMLNVCFIASNHTSGGNSGSPVLNADGELIGINFDRNWEGTMSDLYYNPAICRNITVDIRYVLFIIDKYAGASHLIDEMDLVR
jgi:hypothetical protein